MKKTFMIILLAFVMVCADVIYAYSWVTITIKIARKKDCLGFGLCRFTIQSNDIAARPVGNDGKALAEMRSDGHLILKLNKKTDISPEAFETYFSNGVFVCEDDFPVPDEVLKAMDFKGKYTIKAGSYDVKQKGDLLTVVF